MDERRWPAQEPSSRRFVSRVAFILGGIITAIMVVLMTG